MLTLALGLAAVGALVYFVGLEESREAASRAGSTAGSAASTAGSAASRGLRSTAAAGVFGAGVGIQYGNELVNAILADPGWAVAAVAGIAGALGTGGFLGSLTGVQFLLIGVVVFMIGYAVFGGDD
ncbi:hypothetical protein [Halorubrum aethiopicum]|uniref:hypothetical protein n=1 Tax=Halorubrum aethiopicum TaxID=1758255 RepID=UPI00082BD2F9|nr:hypothetical protein [Halorubrum aethiopicum]